MSAEPIMEPVMTQQDPIDLLIAIEKASTTPIRPEYVEGMAIVPPAPNDSHRRRPSELDDSYLKAHRGWYPIDMIALVGEVTSSNHETDTDPKLRTYAAAGVPIHVLINRNTKSAHCHTAPVLPGDDPEAFCDPESKVGLGNPLVLPAPYPILDTAPFLEN
ncbi:Uma2 family endonuclease [Streptomyces sp. NPDC059272]|uniref:Uma2 family endonuclease n=1 Tax=Streptomyces sp. NPDC059272 TaxID=3346800 RepID=UPI0036BB19B0